MQTWISRNLYVVLAFAACAQASDGGGSVAVAEHRASETAMQTKLELELSETGKVVETEVELPVGSLPAAVTAAVAGKGTISEAEVIVRESGVFFEVEIGDTEYAIDPNGTILGQETEVDEPGDDED